MFFPEFVIAVDQGAGVALELLGAVPMRRGRITGSVFRPIGIGGVMAKHRLAIDGELQREVRIDPNELRQEI
jgi:hypothetical protein